VSIYNADYASYVDIPLVISIDGGGTAEMQEIAEQFEWKYGEKRIIAHKENLGLRKHIIACGDLTEESGDVIMLEDDLFVSPYFYDYAVKALDFYKDDEKIAGISLYTYEFIAYVKLPFVPLQNGYDVFFMQIPSSWGQAWTTKQWKSFKRFYETNPIVRGTDKLPDSVKSWPETSWKKYFYKYIVDNDLYFVYPYTSYSTNFGDIGVHYTNFTSRLQVSLMTVLKNNLFPKFGYSSVIYDAYFELLPRCFWQRGVKENTNFCVDVYGSKQLGLFNNDYCFSIKETDNPIEQYAIDLVPIENNIICEFSGNKISYAKLTDYNSNHKLGIYNDLSIKYDTVIYERGYVEGEKSVKQTASYKIRYYLLHPLKFLKRLLK